MTHSRPTDKFADDTGLTGLITNDDDFHYTQKVDIFVDWYEKNYLGCGNDHRF